jgi:hypothetical protein
LAQFRSNAYNFNVTVSRSDQLQLVAAPVPRRGTAGA